MIALVDGDIVRYRTGFASNTVEWSIAKWRCKETIEQILQKTGATEFRMYLSDSKENNFRYKLYPRYKESREKMPKPLHHDSLKDYLIQEWGAVVAHGQEADDALGIDQSQYILWNRKDKYAVKGTMLLGPTETIICSIDKDLLQVPGKHYNWVKDEFTEITAAEGIRRFYLQCLTGDRTDDIYGLQGIGPVKAGKALAGADNEHDFYKVVKSMWNDDERLLMTARLLWVRRKPDELWTPPLEYFTQDTTHLSQSSPPKLSEIGPCSAHGFQEPSGVPQHGEQTECTSEPLTQDLT